MKAGQLEIEIIAQIAKLQDDMRKVEQSVGGMANVTARSTRAVNDNLASVGRSAGSTRAGMQQLSFQISDVASSFASGINPMVIFAQQGSQVVQSIALMRGSAGGLVGFLAGPWGAAMMGAVTVAGLLVPKLFETSKAMDDVRFASGAVGNAQNILGNVMDITTGKINTQNSALVALARAQLAVAKVQAQTRQAEAKSEIRGAGKLGFFESFTHILDSNKAVMGRGVTQDLMKSLLGGATSANNVLKSLESLNNAGMITDEAFTKAAAAVANFGVEGENLKVYESAQRVLDGVGTALDRNIILRAPKAKKATKDVDDALKELLKTAEELADQRAEAQGNVQKLVMDMIKRQQDWKDVLPNWGDQDKEARDRVTDAEERRRRVNEDAIAALLDGFALIEVRSNQAADAMANAFGRVGGAIGDISALLVEYGHKQEAIDKQVALGMISEADGRRATYRNQVKGFGAVAGAAKGLFKEHSAGYKAMAAAEKAFAIVQLAGTAIDVARGAAKMFSFLGPFAFPAVAAMMAVMASFGFKGGGGGKGASFDLKSYQDAMGTGSVLGDSSAKSDSIGRSLELMSANSEKELEYSNAMVRSLRAIENNIGSLSSLLAKQLGITGGAFDTSGLGLGSNTSLTGIMGGVFGAVSKIPVIGGLLGGIGKALFGTTVTKTLLDQGIMFNPETVLSILSGGIDGQTYQDIATKKKKKFLGVTTSNKTKVSTSYGVLDGGVEDQIGLLIGSMRDGILSAANVLGIEGAGAVLDAFRVDLGKISLKDLTGTEIEEQLKAIFSKLGDDMAASAVANLDAFQKVGEGQFETLMRLAKDYQTIDVQMQSIGRTFGAVGASSVEAREALIDLFGSLDNLVDQTQFYRDNFLTEAEQIAPVMSAVSTELARLNLSGVDSIAGFKSVVSGIDLTTAAGRDLYAAMMALAPGFAAVEKYQAAQAQAAADLAKTRTSMEITLLEAMGKSAEALALRRQGELAAMDASLRPLQLQIYAWQDLATAQEAAAQKVGSAKDILSSAYDREASALEATASKFRDFAKVIGDFRTGLFAGVPGADGYAQLRARFDSTASMARFGNEASLEAFTGDAQAYLDASRARAGSALDYARDLARVAIAADQAQAGANGLASAADQQLAALKASVAQLIELDETVVSVAQAITDLRVAQAEADRLQRDLDKAANPVPELAEVNLNLVDMSEVIERLNLNQAATNERLSNMDRNLQAALVAIATNTGESARIARRHDRGDAMAVNVEAD